MTEEAEFDARDAVRDLEQARRDSRRQRIDFWEALYQAYVAGFALAGAAAVVASFLPEDQVTAGEFATVIARAPAVVGLVLALAVAVGLRSGSRGGPLVFEPPTVHYLLQSPVDRAFITRRSALSQLRSAATWGAGGGMAVGLGTSAALPGGAFLLVVGFGVVGVLTAVALFASALVASGHRLKPTGAAVIGLAVVGWSAADLVARTATSPMSLIGELALLKDTARVTSLIGIVVVAALLFLAMASAGSISLEAALRRSGLVSQIRFALTMQDLRTVVVLRRRLTGHTHRSKAWLPIPRTTGNRAPALQRTMRGLLHSPPSTLIRAATLGIGAGAALGLAQRWAAPVALLTGLLLFLAAYDFVEALAQEIDKPTLWANKPVWPGDIVVRLTMAGAACMAPVAVVAVVTAWLVGGVDMLVVALGAVPAATVGAAVGAGVSTVLGAPTISSASMESEMFALTTVPRILAPPAIAVIPLIPVVAGIVGDVAPAASGTNSLFLMGITCSLALMWLRSRKPEMT
ncbi:MAG: hypothetical protein WBV06_18520 [Acidimicrobiia bacterium]